MASQSTPTGLIVAQTIGLTASGYLLGQNASFSFISIPAVMQAPAPLAAKQWSTVFNKGGSFALPLAFTSAVSCAYIAYNQEPGSTPFKLNVAAAMLFPSIVPFTVVFMLPTNKKLTEKMNSLASASLEDKAIEAGVSQEETTHSLLDKWATLNLLRAGLVAAGTLCATLAAVNKRELIEFSGIGLGSGANRM